MSQKAPIKFSRDEFHQMCGNHNLNPSPPTLFNDDDDSSAEEDFKELDAAYYDLKPNDDEDSAGPSQISGQDMKEIVSWATVLKKKKKNKSRSSTRQVQSLQSVQDYRGSLNMKHKQDNGGTSNNGFTNDQSKQMFLDVVANQHTIKNQLMQLMQNYHSEAVITATNAKKLNKLEEIVNQTSSFMHLNEGEVKQQITVQVAHLSRELKFSQDELKEQMTKLSSGMKHNLNEIKQSITSIKTKNMHANTLNTAVQLLRNLNEKVDSHGEILHNVNYNNCEISDLIEGNCAYNSPQIIKMLLEIQNDIKRVHSKQREYIHLLENKLRGVTSTLSIQKECICRLQNELVLARRTSDASFLGKLVPFTCAKLLFNSLFGEESTATFLALVAMHLWHKIY